MPILHRDNCFILVGRILLFVWDTHFYIRMSTLIVKTGKISLFARDAYFHSGTVNIGIGVPIFGGAYFHLTPVSGPCGVTTCLSSRIPKFVSGWNLSPFQ